MAPPSCAPPYTSSSPTTLPLSPFGEADDAYNLGELPSLAYGSVDITQASTTLSHEDDKVKLSGAEEPTKGSFPSTFPALLQLIQQWIISRREVSPAGVGYECLREHAIRPAG